MTLDADPTRRARERTAWGRGARKLGWALLVSWVAILAAVVVLGESPSTLSRLEGDVAVGGVQEVRVAGGLPPEGRGYSVVEVHWRRGLGAYTTDVIVARPLGAAPRSPGDEVTAVIDESVRSRLQATDPGVQVLRVRREATSTELLGHRVPGWMALSVLAVTLVALGLTALGPLPLRATRWAWFWLIVLAPVVGVTAYLLLGGPTALISPPRESRRRLRGGWAFLLALLIPSPFG